MEMFSLVLAVAGIVTVMFHYVNHGIAIGVVSLILLAVSFVIGSIGMKKQEKSGGIKTDVFNPALLGHGISSVVLVVCGIMCLIANVR